MHIEGILFHQINGNGPFSGKNGILGLVHFSIVRPYQSIVYGIPDGNIICCRCKFCLLVKIQTVPRYYSIIIVYSGIFNSVSVFNFGVIESTFAIHFIGFPGDGGRTVQISIFGLGIIIQLFGNQIEFRVHKVHTLQELGFFKLCKVASNFTGKGVGGINYGSVMFIESLLFFPVEP